MLFKCICSITDCPDDTFQVQLSAVNDRVRSRILIDYLGRGLFLVQYRMYADYLDATITITHAGGHVSESPYPLRGVLHEHCFCPLNSVDEWLDKFKCPLELDSQIAEDLEPFRMGINITGLYERAGEAYPSNSFVHYSVVDGKVGVATGIVILYYVPCTSSLCECGRLYSM